MTRPDEIAALADEDELADFIYQVQDYSHAKRKAAMLWPPVHLSATALALAEKAGGDFLTKQRVGVEGAWDKGLASAATPTPPSADVERLSRDWKTVEEQIASASGNDFLILMRDYLHINSGPGNDLAPLYIARINLLIQSAAHGGGTEGGEA
jgi:hypothetical protein